MDNFTQIGLLLDVYGSILTDKQQSMMDMRYCQDLSLGEISELTECSRQAVNDSIRRSVKLLEQAEKNIGFLAYSMKMDLSLTGILNDLRQLSDSLSQSEDGFCHMTIMKIVDRIKELMIMRDGK